MIGSDRGCLARGVASNHSAVTTAVCVFAARGSRKNTYALASLFAANAETT
jgi:hypothetical protein